VDALLDDARRSELGEHRARRRITRRIAEFFADLLDRGVVAKGVEDLHDFALATAQFWLHAPFVARPCYKRSRLSSAQERAQFGEHFGRDVLLQVVTAVEALAGHV